MSPGSMDDASEPRAGSRPSSSSGRDLPTRRSLVSLMSLPRLRSSSPEMRRRTKSLYAQGSVDRKFAAKVSREIDAQLEKDKKKMEKVVKLLLLGPAESGKTTVVKQMQIIHLNGFTKEQLMAMRSYIYANVVVAMGQILKGMKKIGIELPSEFQEDANHVFLVSRETRALKCLSERLVLAVKRLWLLDEVQTAHERRSEFQVIDCARYFLDAIDRLASPEYCPTQKDVLHARTKTTGVNELRYPYNEKELL
ncbi:guanine nucleotide-binding protein G(I) alpha subunit, partial [Aphelenchoides avenae]